MAKSKFDSRAKAAAYVAWIANDKNERKTSGELGIPHSTFRYWVKTWEEKGPPEDVAGELTEQVFSFVDHASRIRNAALCKLEELIPQAEVKQLSAIATVVGIMDDKIRLASGLATKRTENTYVLPSKDDLKGLMGSFVDGLVDAADDRSKEIIEISSESVVVSVNEPVLEQGNNATP